MVNSKQDLSQIPTLNNDGNSYIIPLDTYKEGYWAYNISNYFKGRVGDNGTLFMIQWSEHGQLKNVQGLRPFISGQVGNYTIDDEDPNNPHVIMAADASTVDITGDVTDTRPGGIAIYRMIEQAFPQSGIFYGAIGLRGTDADGRHQETSVDVAFKVMDGNMTMLGARKYYVSELEKALLEYKEAFNKQSNDFKAQSDKLIQDARTQYMTETQATHDSLNALQSQIQANRDEQATLSNRLVGTEQQIAEHDVVTRPEFESGTKRTEELINEKLSKFKFTPQPINSYDDLVTKYPSGQDGIFVALNNQHMYMWLNSHWEDGGVYQAQGIDIDTQSKISESSALIQGNNYIKNGSFASKLTGSALPTNEHDKLQVVENNGLNFLEVVGEDYLQWHGVRWRFDPTEIKGPLHFETDIITDKSINVEIYFVGVDTDSKNKDVKSIYSLKTEAGILHHIEADFLPSVLSSNYKYELRIQQPEEDKSYIKITNVVLKTLKLANTLSEYNEENNLIKGYQNIPYVTATKGQLSSNYYLNRFWYDVKNDVNESYTGFQFESINNIANYIPLNIQFDIKGSQESELALFVLGLDENNNFVSDGYVQSLKSLPINFDNGIIHINETFTLDQELLTAKKLIFRIQQVDEKAVTLLEVSGIKLNYVNTSLESKNLFNSNSKGEAIDYAFCSNAYYSKYEYLNSKWINLKSDKAWAGIELDTSFIRPNLPFFLNFKVDSAESHQLYIFCVGINKNHQFIDGSESLIDVFDVNAFEGPKEICVPFLLSDKYKDAESLEVRIQQPTDVPITSLKFADLNLRYNLLQNHQSNNELLPRTLLGNSTLYSSFSDNSIIYTDEGWLKLADETQTNYKGFRWNITNVDLSKELHLELDVKATENIQLIISAVGYDTNGQQLDPKYPNVAHSVEIKGDNQPQHISFNFKVQAEYDNAYGFQLRIQQPGTSPIKSLCFKNPSLRYAEKVNINELENKYGLPIINISGDLSGMTKENAKKVTYEYTNSGTKLSGYAQLKWQGNSSLNQPKKGFRLQPYKDETYSKKDKVQFIPQWSPTKKINLKAYYTDGLLSRDPVNANIGAAIASTNEKLPSDLQKEDNLGFIDGFPVVLMFNSTFQGIYSLNLARSDFDYTKYAIMGNGYSKVTAFTSTDKAEVKLDGSDFESLNPEDKPTDDEKNAVGDLVTWVSTSNDDDFKAHFEEHLDLQTTIDYFILANLLASGDSFSKNQIFLSWDGKKWYMQAYDLDSTLGIGWDGKEYDLPNDVVGTNNKLFKRLNQLFESQISKRYTELRAWLNVDYVLEKYKSHINAIGVSNYQKEYDKWNNPSRDTATYKQLKNAVIHQFKLLDSKWLISDSTESIQSQIDAIQNQLNNTKNSTNN